MIGKTLRPSIWAAGVFALALLGVGTLYWLPSRQISAVPTIAFIPQTAGALLWEVEHLGATAAAEKWKCRLYWNAPTAETDVGGQVLLIDKVSRGKYQGLVVAPNHPLTILSPLRRALAAGVPVVIVSSSLDLPAGAQLGYVVNDDERMGEQAAEEVARLIGGKGSIALAGLARQAPGVTRRARSAEGLLASRFPDVHVVSRIAGAYDASRTEELIGGTLDSHPELNAILSFTATSTRGVHAALKNRSLQSAIPLVGCEQDSDLIGYLGTGEIAALLAENTYRMGYEAVGIIAAFWAGHPIPARSVVPPLLLTLQTLGSAEANLVTGGLR